MLEISDLGLTMAQIIEVNDADPVLVDAWLMQASGPTIDNPTSLFLWGLRTGNFPDEDPAREVGRVRVVQQAERWIQNVGLFLDREEELVDELFGRHGKLKAYADDTMLQKRMVVVWVKHRPTGVEVEEEARARAERNGRTYFALREVKKDGAETATEPVGGPAGASAHGEAGADRERAGRPTDERATATVDHAH